MAQTTGDLPYVRKLFTNAEKLANYFDDYMNLAGLIAGDLNDKEWADRIYSEQFESAGEFLKKKNIRTQIKYCIHTILFL